MHFPVETKQEVAFLLRAFYIGTGNCSPLLYIPCSSHIRPYERDCPGTIKGFWGQWLEVVCTTAVGRPGKCLEQEGAQCHCENPINIFIWKNKRIESGVIYVLQRENKTRTKCYLLYSHFLVRKIFLKISSSFLPLYLLLFSPSFLDLTRKEPCNVLGFFFFFLGISNEYCSSDRYSGHLEKLTESNLEVIPSKTILMMIFPFTFFLY